jgi:hypothetical protein
MKGCLRETNYFLERLPRSSPDIVTANSSGVDEMSGM